MPFVGRYTKYPIYPEFNGDPTQFNNILAVSFQYNDLAVGATADFQLKIAGKEIRVYDFGLHFLESVVDFTVFEDATCTDGLNVITPANTDRNSPFLSSIFASSNPTGISGGVKILGLEHFGLVADLVGFGEEPPVNLQYVTLKFNSNYIFRFTNTGSEIIKNLRFLVLWSE